MPIPGHTFLSAIAGLSGALASVSAKFAFGDLPIFLTQDLSLIPISSNVICWLFRAVFVLATVLLNGVMWTFYMKALRISGNSLQALAVNTACNFVSSAGFGYLFFGDLITGSWIFGAALMLMGVILMNTGDAVLKPEESVTAASSKKIP